MQKRADLAIIFLSWEFLLIVFGQSWVAACSARAVENNGKSQPVVSDTWSSGKCSPVEKRLGK